MKPLFADMWRDISSSFRGITADALDSFRGMARDARSFWR